MPSGARPPWQTVPAPLWTYMDLGMLAIVSFKSRLEMFGAVEAEDCAVDLKLLV